MYISTNTSTNTHFHTSMQSFIHVHMGIHAHPHTHTYTHGERERERESLRNRAGEHSTHRHVNGGRVEQSHNQQPPKSNVCVNLFQLGDQQWAFEGVDKGAVCGCVARLHMHKDFVSHRYGRKSVEHTEQRYISVWSGQGGEGEKKTHITALPQDHTHTHR